MSFNSVYRYEFLPAWPKVQGSWPALAVFPQEDLSRAVMAWLLSAHDVSCPETGEQERALAY
jgi:hypothetical protein